MITTETIPELNTFHTKDEDKYGVNKNGAYRKKGESIGAMLKRVNWISGSVLVLTPLISIWALFNIQMQTATMIWAVLYYIWTGLGITAGYHRLWSHRAYKATLPVRLFLMMGGTGAVQGSCRWWSRNHRIHHRFTDTPKDPYNAREGFLYSHFGWMLFQPDFSLIDKKRDFDISDLEEDPMVRFQNKYYGLCTLFMGFIFPALVSGLLWGDYIGGYFFAGIARLVFVHHATFFVNSLAHIFGDQPFADRETPRDHVITAILTLGEGYHNFHHEFPQDYRNALKFYQYDPTKWFIKGLSLLGLTYDLQQFGDNEIEMGKWQMKKKRALLKEEKIKNLKINHEIEKKMTFRDYVDAVQSGENLINIAGYVHDITDFISKHPGGEEILVGLMGKDATHHFNSQSHSEAAQRLLEKMRVAELVVQKEH